ncbi:MAG TPA: cytochrome c oxidase assembly protein [Bryobacteraceae bacterium]|nr:cytochrome c oxidase assembly protein [Bryobacteraceae bacterium]
MNQPVLGWRLAAFVGGVAAVWLAVFSPVAHLDHHLLTVHMVQHLLLMVLAAPLILLGAPLLTKRSQIPFLTKRGQLSGPCLTFCWLVGSLTVLVWHVPMVFELALRSHFWHHFEHASFFIAGVVFWWPVIQPSQDARWSVPLYLFLATLPCDALSAFLVFCGYVVYRPYLSGHGHFGLSPLGDQALAGALMWITVTFAYLIPALVVTAQLLSDDRRDFLNGGFAASRDDVMQHIARDIR